LELRPARRQRQREQYSRSRKVFADFRFGLVEQRMIPRHDGEFCPLPQPQNLALEPAPVDPIEHVQAVIVGKRKNGAERRIDPAREQAMHAARL